MNKKNKPSNLKLKAPGDQCYAAGFDCAIHGADTINCHFSFFSSVEKTKRWEAGKKDGDKAKESLRKPQE